MPTSILIHPHDFRLNLSRIDVFSVESTKRRELTEVRVDGVDGVAVPVIVVGIAKLSLTRSLTKVPCDRSSDSSDDRNLVAEILHDVKRSPIHIEPVTIYESCFRSLDGDWS